jgi:hypothetical protein
VAANDAAKCAHTLSNAKPSSPFTHCTGANRARGHYCTAPLIALLSLRPQNPAAAPIQYPKLPSIFSESVVLHRGPVLFPGAKNLRRSGARADILAEFDKRTKKVEIKATAWRYPTESTQSWQLRRSSAANKQAAEACSLRRLTFVANASDVSDPGLHHGVVLPCWCPSTRNAVEVTDNKPESVGSRK